MGGNPTQFLLSLGDGAGHEPAMDLAVVVSYRLACTCVDCCPKPEPNMEMNSTPGVEARGEWP